jgi:hypothetical protein
MTIMALNFRMPRSPSWAARHQGRNGLPKGRRYNAAVTSAYSNKHRTTTSNPLLRTQGKPVSRSLLLLPRWPTSSRKHRNLIDECLCPIVPCTGREFGVTGLVRCEFVG